MCISNQPVIDTGGVRRHIYSTLFNDFVSNKYFMLFEGPQHSVRPICTDESQLIVQYKAKLNLSKLVCVCISNQLAIYTGGVRRHIYSTLFNDFVSNKYFMLFEGPQHSVQPICTDESQSCGLFKIFGKMVGHSIVQEGIGSPFFPNCVFRTW